MDRRKLFISLLEAFIQKPDISDGVKQKSIAQLEIYLKDAPLLAKFGFSFLLYLVEYLPLFSRGGQALEDGHRYEGRIHRRLYRQDRRKHTYGPEALRYAVLLFRG